MISQRQLEGNRASAVMSAGPRTAEIKARSVDVTKEPSEIFKRETDTLKKMFEISKLVHLEPFDKAHVMIIF
jgi:fibrillarin-like rRNA methylase